MPVLILTARDALHDRDAGPGSGAPTITWSTHRAAELLARLRALLRFRAATSAVLAFRPAESTRQPARHGPWPAARARPSRTDGDGMLINAPKPASKEKLLHALTGWDEVT